MGVVGFIFAVVWLACGRHHVSSGISAGDSASGGSKIKTASRYEYISARGELGDTSDARRPSKGSHQSIGGGRGKILSTLQNRALYMLFCVMLFP